MGLLVISHTSRSATTFQGVIVGMGSRVKGVLEVVEVVGYSLAAGNKPRIWNGCW
jgi:hypothetical protein